MPVYLKKSHSEVLSEALEKLTQTTTITSVGPGSVARSIAESITSEIGDLYDVLDFNITQTYISTATGSALNALGALYGIERKQVSDLAVVDKSLGSFLFYIDNALSVDVVIPRGTNVYTSVTSYVGRQHSFSTTTENVIIAGRTRTYASLTPNFVDTVYTAGANTLVFNDANIPGITLRCTNPKGIAPLPGYETDDDYRLRLMKSIRVTAAGTIEAVRFAGLGVANVRDIKITQAPYGMGSFEAIIVPEQNNNVQQTLVLAKTAMDTVKPLGVRMFTRTPTILPMDINVSLFIPGANATQISDTVISRAVVGIRRYLEGLMPGNPLVYNRLIQIIIDSSELVRDVSINSITINGSPQLNKNYQPKDDEQITSGNIVVNIGST